MRDLLCGLTLSLVIGAAALGQLPANFVNWESPHVNPIDLTPDGGRLLAVNTPDNRLEVFAVDGTSLEHLASIPVGLDPVSVRARTNDEAWVVNHVSDSVSIVSLTTMNVTATITTGNAPGGLGDEPTDVVFAGSPQRAFVSVSQLNQVKVYDPADLSVPPIVLNIEGEDPRALATDGTRVYAAIFESGNDTTVLGQTTVSSPVNPYPLDQNPPPNSGAGFDPPIAVGLPVPPAVSLIVRKDTGGAWRDVNGFDWSAAVTWDLHDHDVAVIDAGSLGISYVTGLMNLNMNLAVGPGGQVLVVGTEAINEVRFEPILNGRFLRVRGALFTPPAGGASSIVDLNPHLDYTTSTVPQGMRDQSIGDPRGVAWDGSGQRFYVSGMGSNNLVVLDGSLGRVGRIEVGEGPTGVAVNEGAGLVYVLNKFEGSISIVNAGALSETGRVSFFDPTPADIKAGRPFLYDTHRSSGLGMVSCGSCHIDGRMDQLAWDLGNPQGALKVLPDTLCNGGIPPLDQLCEDFFHPMKGPMATQTLMGIATTEPFHWRGDNGDLSAFNPAFENLMGDDTQLTDGEMDLFQLLVESLDYPPNPFRALNGQLTPAPIDGGNAVIGRNLFLTGNLDGVQCATCHALPTGTNGTITSGNLLLETQSIKVPQLRNMYEKTGFQQGSLSNNRGFGFIHDGSVDTLFSFFQFPGFNFAGGATGDQQRRDVAAFMMAVGTDTHAGVGAQATLGGAGPDQTLLRNQLIGVADTGQVDLVARGVQGGEARGYHYLGGGQFQSDRLVEVMTIAMLDAGTGPGSELTYTLVPAGSGQRIGVDRDDDGFFDGDEIDACSDPADGGSVPQPGGCGSVPGDIDGDGDVDVDDLVQVILGWGPCPDPPAMCPADLDEDGDVDVDDLTAVILNWS